MNVLITGGTGLIGYALNQSLLKQGIQVTVVSRFPAKAKHQFSQDTQIFESIGDIPHSHKISAIVNLAGAQIVGKRWTRTRKKSIWSSRVDLTRNLVQWLEQREQKPEVMISGSAIGIYGDCEEQSVDELHSPGQDFGAQLCTAWEAEAVKAESLGIRVCLARTGLVLSTRGGMLQQMLLPFRLGFGGKISHGRQWMSWIHIEDHIAALEFMLRQPELSGAFNLTSPGAERNKTFTASLAQALKRPCVFTAPAPVIRLALGEASELLLGGQRVSPKRLLDSGFQFKYPTLDQTLLNLLT